MERNPVFLDPSGRRWRVMRAMIVGTLVLLVSLGALTIPQMLADPYGRNGLKHLSAQDVGGRPPVVGVGPLVRVLKVEGNQGLDPFTSTPLVKLTDKEMSQSDGAKFVLQKYGYTSNRAKTISLTFDDGPSAKYTPQLLDMLSREHVPATFFVTGASIAKNPEIMERIHREGHAIANHTLTHVDLSEASSLRAYLDLVAADHIIRATTGEAVAYARMPYEGDDDEGMQETVNGILATQRLGYVVTSHDFDTLDWLNTEQGTPIPFPELHGQNLTLLLHDSGGTTRQPTLEYTAKLIQQAKDAGYTFTTMEQANPELAASVTEVTPTWGDKADLYVAELFFKWPTYLGQLLFIGAVLSVLVVGALNAGLTLIRRKRRVIPPYTDVPVTVLVAAYNEEKVIERTLRSILTSVAPLAEILVVNDGSRDGTAKVVSRLAQEFPIIRLINQVNTGKAGAQNNGFRQASSPFVVTFDADTNVTPNTVGNLVRHLAADTTGLLAAVAGVVRVGNRSRNIITRWQALEYVSQIGVERAAQDALGAISIVPGACAAWRRDAVLSVGGYSEDTLAEDNDICLALHQMGFKVTQDDEAAAYTEAPETVDALLSQRTRWTFGTMQAIYKHRSLIFRPRYGWLGMVILPMYVSTVVLPLIFLPFIAFIVWMTLKSGGLFAVLPYMLAFGAAHALVAAVAVFMLKERKSLLWILPIYRIVFEPLRAYLLYNSAWHAIKGVRLGWNKLARTAHMDTARIKKLEAAPVPTAIEAAPARPELPPAPVFSALTSGKDAR